MFVYVFMSVALNYVLVEMQQSSWRDVAWCGSAFTLYFLFHVLYTYIIHYKSGRWIEPYSPMTNAKTLYTRVIRLLVANTYFSFLLVVHSHSQE